MPNRSNDIQTTKVVELIDIDGEWDYNRLHDYFSQEIM